MARPGAGVRWQGHESCGSRILGHPPDGRSVGLGDPQVARADNPTEPFQPLALSKQPAVKALKSVSVTRPSGALRCGDLLCQFRLTNPRMSVHTDKHGHRKTQRGSLVG